MNSIQSALSSMRRNFTMTSASILLVTLTLLVVGFVFQISVNTTKMTESVLDSLKVYAYVDATASDKESKKVGEEIKKLPEVESVDFSSKEDELKAITETMGSNAEDIQKNFEGDANPLNDVYIITTDLEKYDLEELSQKIDKIDGIESTEYGQSDGTNDFIAIMKLIQNTSVFVAAVLLFASLFIITNTIKLTITARRTEIEIMRLVGATKMFIRLPFMIEGMLIGLIGGLFSFGVLHIFYQEIYNSDLLILIKSSLATVGQMDHLLIISLPLIGIVIGSMGSLWAMRRYLIT